VQLISCCAKHRKCSSESGPILRRNGSASWRGSLLKEWTTSEMERAMTKCERVEEVGVTC
jgi:hypothetical protein